MDETTRDKLAYVRRWAEEWPAVAQVLHELVPTEAFKADTVQTMHNAINGLGHEPGAVLEFVASLESLHIAAAKLKARPAPQPPTA